MPAPRAHVENTCARGADMHGFFSVSHITHTTTPHTHTTTTPHPHPHHTQHGDTTPHERQRHEEETKEKKTREEKREDPFSVWWCMAVFLVGGVNRLVNFVDDRDFCLLFCVKYDSYLITGFIVQRAHFQNSYRLRFIPQNLIGNHFGQHSICCCSRSGSCLSICCVQDSEH